MFLVCLQCRIQGCEGVTAEFSCGPERPLAQWNLDCAGTCNLAVSSPLSSRVSFAIGICSQFFLLEGQLKKV